MSSPAGSVGASPAQAPPRTALDSSCRAITRGLDNAAQVLAALALTVDEQGTDTAELQRRLRRAAARIDEAAMLVAGEPGGLPSPLAKMLGVNEETDDSGLTGHSEMISLPDFVSFISNLCRDGVLEVQANAESFTLELQQGAVVYVTGDSPHGMRLGDLLTGDGTLTQDQLSIALKDRLENEVLGDALLRLGLIEVPALQRALSTQMYQLFARMHEVGTGFDFHFDEGRHVMPDSHARLGASQLLLEGARLLDEGALLRRKEEQDDGELFSGGLDTTWLADFHEDQGHLDVESFREFVEVLFLEESLTLPCLPANTSRLLKLTHGEDVDLELVLREVGADPAFTAHVLRAASTLSPTPDGAPVTLQSAARQLGESGLRNLAVGLTLNGCAVGLGTWETEIRSLWRTAVIAGEFGTLLGRDHLADGELGQVLALLQDIGKPVVLGAIHDIEKECECRLAPSAANHVMEEFHTRAGAWLARKWRLAPALVQVIECHHGGEQLAGEDRLRVRVASLAHELAVAVQRPAGAEVGVLAALPACTDLGLDAELLQVLIEERAESSGN